MKESTNKVAEDAKPGDFTGKLATLADAFEMYQAEGRSLNVGFENDRLNEIRQGQSSGVSIRAVKDGKIGFSYSSKPDELDYVAQAAIRMAPYGKAYDYQFAGEARSSHTRPFDPACGDLNPDQLVAICNRIKDTVKAIDSEALVDCSVGGGIGSARIVTSNGQDCREEQSNFSFFVSLRLAEEGNFVQNYRFGSANEIIPQETILAEAKATAEEFQIARKRAEISKGKYTVLVAPSALSDLLMPIMVSVNGNAIEKKTSRFVDALGEKLFDERLTLTDDPFHKDGVGGGLYDGEGVPTQKRAIIDKGTVSGFVHTLSTANRCGQEPTGNAQRGVSSLPSPGMHNLVMDAGSDNLADLMTKADGGIYLRSLLGSFTSNFLAGQVSGNISLGFLVKDGQLVGRVKNCALNVNSFDLLKSNILGISKEREWMGGRYLPWLLVEGVQISAR
ncbi:MAG: TldD/PmbA family protein [Planctomycetes bacterium]|nr:TldD/PmbA family protein [Planctomycetota bacterium]